MSERRGGEQEPARPLSVRPSIFAGSTVVAGFSTRAGGVSEGPFESLNLGASVGDDPDRVRANRERFVRSLGLNPSRIATTGQVHGARVRAVAQPGHQPGFDGLVTSVPGMGLALTAADCAIVLMADTEAGVVGGCHAGWRGAVAGVVERTIEEMSRLGAAPPSMRAYVSPCISVDHFEVGEEVANRFPSRFVHRSPRRSRPYVDLKAFLLGVLLQAGLVEDGIEIDPACTAGASERFYSHRGSGGRTGRHWGVIALSDG